MKFRIFVQHDPTFSEVARITVPALYKYAIRHGYDIHEGFGVPVRRGVVWDRYAIMPENSLGADWLVHMDADVLITNHYIRLEELVAEAGDADILMASCVCEDNVRRLNDGVSFFRNTPATLALMNRVFNDPPHLNARYGQDVLQRWYEEDAMPVKLKTERPKSFNSFLYTEYDMPETTTGHWTPGDFVLHLPGIANTRRVDIFKSTLPNVIK